MKSPSISTSGLAHLAIGVSFASVVISLSSVIIPRFHGEASYDAINWAYYLTPVVAAIAGVGGWPVFLTQVEGGNAMRKRQAKKIEKKRAARYKATVRAAMHRKPTQIIIGECSDPLVPGFMESFTKTVGCGVALVGSEQSISGLK